MKKIIFCLAAVLMLAACNNKSEQDNQSATGSNEAVQSEMPATDVVTEDNGEWLKQTTIMSAKPMVIDFFAPKTNGVLLSCIQFLVSSVICGVIAFIVEQPTFDQLQSALVPILYTGIMSSGVAYTMQILGQRNFNPTVAAMIMSFESVISAVAGFLAWEWGFLTQDQSLSALQILGCVIVFAAVIFVQLPIGKIKRRGD